MYHNTDKSAAIRTVQKYLSTNESGIYDDNTKYLVTLFQRENNLETTGIVDYKTFDLLKSKHIMREKISNARRSIANHRFPYSIGDFGDDVALINVNLSNALLPYTHEEIMPKGAHYTQYSASAVKRLREIYMVSGESVLDELLYYRILCDILI